MRDDDGLEDPVWVMSIIFILATVLFVLKEYI